MTSILTTTPNLIGLVRFLLALALAEREALNQADDAVGTLLKRALYLTEAGESRSTSVERSTLWADIQYAAPQKYVRRNVHSHARVTNDRHLLVLREGLSVLGWSDRGVLGKGWYTLWLLLAYAVSDYDRNHFEMKGTATAFRLRRLIAWMEANLPKPHPRPDPRRLR